MGRDSIVQSYMTMKKQPLTNAMIVEGRTTKKKEPKDMGKYNLSPPITVNEGSFVKAVVEQAKQAPKGPYEAGALVRLRSAIFTKDLFVVLNSTPAYVQVQEFGGLQSYTYPCDYVVRYTGDPTKVNPVSRPLAVEIKPGKEIVAKNIKQQPVVDSSTTLFDLSHNKTLEDL